MALYIIAAVLLLPLIGILAACGACQCIGKVQEHTEVENEPLLDAPPKERD